MTSGIWTIVIQTEAADFAVQRRFTLQSGVPERTMVTVWLFQRLWPTSHAFPD